MIPGLTPSKVAISGHKINYYRCGSGPTVLLVHGITTYSFIWRNLLPELSKTHDVIALDLLGCGNSDMPLDISYAIKDHASYLREFAEALNLPPFHFVGHDLGGGMGQIFAIRHPEMLRSLSLLNTVGYDFWPVQPITALRTPIVRQLLMATLDHGTFRLVVRRGIHHGERVTDALMDLFLAPFKTEAGRKAFLHFARCLDNHNLTEIAPELQSLDLPVLILRGDRDPYLDAGIAQRLHQDIPGSRYSLLPDAGHFFQEDVPELINSELLDFFGGLDA